MPPDPWPSELDESDPVRLSREAYDTLRTELSERGPRAPAHTCHLTGPNRRLRYRRMALETVVHRLDVEPALGEVTPVPADLAVDGIDEVLSPQVHCLRKFQ